MELGEEIKLLTAKVIPAGMVYEWRAKSVMGKPTQRAIDGMTADGWRFVPSSRHDGMFMPAGYAENGDIVRDGLRLEERPMALTQEALDEERQKASKLVRDQQEQLGLSQRMPDGFSRDNSNLKLSK